MPGDLQPTSAAEKIQAMRVMLQQLVEAGSLRRSWSRPLENHLDEATRAIAENDVTTAVETLTAFRRKVLSLEAKGRLSSTAADILIGHADSTLQQLQEQ